MKAIMISIKPKWCAKIMNGIKTVEVRKNKALASAIQKLIKENGYAEIYVYCSKSNYLGYISNRYIGKVIFKFRCYKMIEARPFFHWCIEKETCLTRDEVLDYLDSKDTEVSNPKRQDKVYAIHISGLEIFDEPRELREFKYNKKFVSYDYAYTKKYIDWELRPLTKAPQNFCYLEVDNEIH